MAYSDLLTRLLAFQFSKKIRALFKIVQLPVPFVQRRRSGWLVGLFLLITVGSNLALTLALSDFAVAALASTLQINTPASLDPGPEPNHHRLFLPIIKRP